MISNKNKVVYLGFHKTGTTSIGALFNRIGLKVIGFWNVCLLYTSDAADE